MGVKIHLGRRCLFILVYLFVLLFTRIYFVVVVVLLLQKDLDEKLAEIERRRLVSN